MLALKACWNEINNIFDDGDKNEKHEVNVKNEGISGTFMDCLDPG
jgi:hypothetical protein